MHERSVKGMTVDTKELVTTIAYLIGVKDDIITKCFEPDYTDLIQKLHENKEASIIRYLSNDTILKISIGLNGTVRTRSKNFMNGG